VYDLKTMLAAECPDEYIDSFANRNPLGAEKSVVLRGLLCDAESDHVELRQRQEQRRDPTSLTSITNALHYFAVYQVSNAHKILLQTLIYFGNNRAITTIKIFYPG